MTHLLNFIWLERYIFSSVTTFGDFLILLVTNFLTKVAQILWLIFGLFEIIQLSCKNDLATIWALLEKIGNFFILSSGHTDH